MELALTSVDWIICAISLCISISAGLFMAIRTKASENSSHYFLAGRKLTWPIVGASLFATNIGAEHLVGLSGDAYRYGLCAGAVELATVICLGMACLFLFPQYIKNKIFTIPEFLELRYTSSARLLFSAYMLVICIMTKMAFHLYAGALVLHAIFGWDIMVMVYFMGVTVALVTIFGGFTAVAYTDTFNTLIIVIGCTVMLITGLYKVGGWHALISQVPTAMHVAKPYDNPDYPFWGIIAGAIYGGIFYWGIDQVNVQRVLGAKDLVTARKGAMFTVLLKLTPIFIFALPGVIAFALFPGQESKATFVVLLNSLLPVGLRGLVLAALLAALIGSSLSVMNSISTLTVRDFIMHFMGEVTEKKQVWWGRLAIVLTTPLAILAAYLIYRTPDGLYKYLQTISIYLAMPITPAIFFGIISKRVTNWGALASVIVGVILAIIFVCDQIMGERLSSVFAYLHLPLTTNYTYRGLWGTIIITIVLFSISALTKKSPAEKLAFTLNEKSFFEPFQGVADWRHHLGLLGLMTVCLYAFLW